MRSLRWISAYVMRHQVYLIKQGHEENDAGDGRIFGEILPGDRRSDNLVSTERVPGTALQGDMT